MPQAENSNTESHEKEKIFLYRGIGVKHTTDIMGNWWTTNPYYALVRVGDTGTFFVAKVQPNELEELASDVSLEGNYQNYFFKEDPPYARTATEEEVEKLRSRTTYAKSGPGGLHMKTPDDAIEIGEDVFG